MFNVCAMSLQLCLTLCDPVDCCLLGSSVHGDFPSKSTGVGCHTLLQGIFPTQELNSRLLYLLHWQARSLSLAPPGKGPWNTNNIKIAILPQITYKSNTTY